MFKEGEGGGGWRQPIAATSEQLDAESILDFFRRALAAGGDKKVRSAPAVRLLDSTI